MKYIQKFFPVILILLLFFWVSISITRTLYNAARVFTGEKQWLFYNEDDKRRALYGDIYPVLQYVDRHFPSNKNALLLALDGKQYFISRYILYPRVIYWEAVDKNILKEKNKYSFVINYHPEETNTRYSLNFFNSLKKNKKTIEIKEGSRIIAEIYL